METRVKSRNRNEMKKEEKGRKTKTANMFFLIIPF